MSVSDEEITFSEVSPKQEWSCEENKTQTASFTLPSEATLISKSAEWVELHNRFENQGCSVANAGTSVTANCWVRGGNRDCVPMTGICNCPGGGDGKARVFGKYRIQKRTTAPFADAVGTLTLSSKKGSFVSLPQRPNSTYSAINLKIFRSTKQVSCPTVYDQISINLPAPSNPGATAVQAVIQTSEKGEFEASADQGQVSIKRITASSN